MLRRALSPLSGPRLVRLNRPYEPAAIPDPAVPTITQGADDLATRFALADELSPELQLALLAIRWNDLGRLCAARLKQEGVWVCADDREQLRRAGLAAPTPDKGYDTLTPQGQWKADDIARIVARKYGIHHVMRGGGYRVHISRCTCGWSQSFTCSPSHKDSTFGMWGVAASSQSREGYRDMKPVRIQRQRIKGWKMPPNTIYVGRGSVWGNPFKVGEPCGVFPEGAGMQGKAETLIPALSVEQAIQFYRDLLDGFISPEMYPFGHTWRYSFLVKFRNMHPADAVHSYLPGKNLACWCSLDQPCHADVLLECANP